MTSILENLPPPLVIAQPSHETIVARQIAAFKTIWAGLRAEDPSLPDYDVQMLETDPAVIGIEAESYREIIINEAIKRAGLARFLAFAEGSNLDHLAAFYDVVRLAGETDARLKDRIILAIQGRSTGGPEERYRAVAMSADLRVQSVAVYRIGRSPVINVAVYSTEPDGVASENLLAKVRAALTAKSVQLVNDTIVVASAVRRVVDLAADMWLLPDADEATVGRAVDALRTAWLAERALGRDLTASWWTSRLVIAGVHDVAPSGLGTFIAQPTEAISIGEVTVTLQGRAY